MKHKFTAGFALVAAIITYHDIKDCGDLPWPPRLIFTGLVFGLLDLLSIFSDDLASVLAFGIVLAAVVNKSFVTGGGDRCTHNDCKFEQNPTAQTGSAPFYPGATGNFTPIPGIGPIVNPPASGGTNFQGATSA